MKKNIFVLFGIAFLFAILFSITPVLGAVLTASNITLRAPASSAVLSGIDTLLNATVDGYEQGWDNATFFIYSAGATANTSEIFLGSARNLTGGRGFELRVNLSRYIEDGADYVFKVVIKNLTSGDTANKTNTGITIDYSVPTTPTSLSPATATTDTDGSVTFSGSVSGNQTTACTLFFDQKNPGTPSYAMTHTSNTCSVSLTSMSSETYNWYIRASDGTNTTNTAINTIRIDTPTSAGKIAKIVQQKGVISEGGSSFSVVGLGTKFGGVPLAVIIIILFVVIYIIYKKRR